MGIGYGLSEPELLTLPSIIMTILITASAIGVIIAWWREAIGGTILVIVGMAHGTNAFLEAGHNVAFAVLISGALFLIIGILFLVSWQRAKILRVSENKK